MSADVPSEPDRPLGTASSGGDLLATPEHRFSMDALDDAGLRAAIAGVQVSPLDEKLTRVDVVGAKGQSNAMMRINHPVRIDVDGPLGHYAFAYLAQADARITGSAGHGVGEGLISGAVRVRGDAGVGAGAAMTGGTLAIYGNADDRCGAAIRGGGIFVRGNVGNQCGLGGLGGLIVIGGDAGESLGEAMQDVTIFVRGSVAALAPGVIEAPLRKREKLRLGLLLINASIRGDAKDFRRIIPTTMWLAEEAGRGEVNPNWR